MSPRERSGDANTVVSKLRKADEFLAVARLALEERHFNAACSNAALAAVNANDAACLAKLGRCSTAQNHREAVTLAREMGPPGREMANKLERLLGLQDKAQYAAIALTERDAAAAVRRAAELIELARSVR